MNKIAKFRGSLSSLAALVGLAVAGCAGGMDTPATTSSLGSYSSGDAGGGYDSAGSGATDMGADAGTSKGGGTTQTPGTGANSDTGIGLTAAGR